MCKFLKKKYKKQIKTKEVLGMFRKNTLDAYGVLFSLPLHSHNYMSLEKYPETILQVFTFDILIPIYVYRFHPQIGETTKYQLLFHSNL